jgi:Fe-S cluster assembly protein SufD
MALLSKSIELPDGPSWLADARRSALKTFESRPLELERDSPIQKYLTDIRSLKFEDFAPGRPSIEIKAPKEAIVLPLAAAARDFETVRKHLGTTIRPLSKLDAMNFALWNSGVFVHVPPNTELKQPITLSHSAEGNSFTRTLVVLGTNSRAEVVEGLSHGNGEFHSEAVEIVLGEAASLGFYSVQDWASGTDVSVRRASLSKDSRIDWVVCSTGSRLSMTSVDTLLNAPGAHANNYGLFVGRGSQHVDFGANTLHAAPSTFNRVVTRGVVTGNATAVTRGFIDVTRSAKLTDSFLQQNTLVLSPEAKANALPTLKIDTNDVKVKHGAWVSQVDEDQLFYLMTRGLSRGEAEQVIVDGFFGAFIDLLPSDAQPRVRELTRWRK